MIDIGDILTTSQMGVEILRAAALPDRMGDLWVALARIEDGVTIFEVTLLREVLGENERDISHGWTSGGVPFALCRSADQARCACRRMRRKQRALAELDAALRVDPMRKRGGQ